jgi:hypothetical protein
MKKVKELKLILKDLIKGCWQWLKVLGRKNVESLNLLWEKTTTIK